MAKIFDKVSPGDLITAELMNQLLETVEGLDGRLAALETATKGSISGTVKDMESGQPIVGAIVKAILGNVSYNSTPSDNQGIYTIADLVPGNYTVLATAENYLNSPAQTVSIAPGIPRVANFLLNRTAGLVAVPKLFGLTLAEARTVVSLPSVNMEIDTVITSHGSVLTADNPEAQTRVILNQVPDEDTAVPAGTKIDVVISAAFEGGVETGNVIIRGFLPNPTERAIGLDLSIVGENFVVPATGNNTVYIISLTGNVLEKITNFIGGSDSEQLNFIIPDVGVPSEGLGLDVSIVVENSNGPPAKRSYRILPKEIAHGNPPDITEVIGPGGDLNTVRVAENFTITGNNFSENAQDNTIHFDTTEVTQIDSGSPTEIVATVPSSISIDDPPGVREMTLFVRVGNHPAASLPKVRVFPPRS